MGSVATRDTAALPVSADILAAMAVDVDDAGFEGADSSCYAIPFLYILQSGSKQCKKSDGAYIKGAEEGMLFNTVTGELIDGEKHGIEVVPCAFQHCFTEWVPKDAGGGFRGEYDAARGTQLLTTCTRNSKGHDILPNGNQLVDSRKHYVLYRAAATADAPAGDWQPALIVMSSTQTKKSKKWMTIMQGIKIPGTDTTAPMYSQGYLLRTVPESNDQGSWYGWAQPQHQGVLTDGNLYQSAKNFREAIRSGAAAAAHSEEEVPY